MAKWEDELAYTTEDEIAYLRSLKRDGKFHALTNYAAAFHCRDYRGVGMSVNKRAVAKELRALLGPDVFSKQGAKHEDDLARMAVAWLEGGNLRAAARKSLLANEGEI